MEELVSPNVQIVLSVKEGKGFDQILSPTVIVATLNGHSLETDTIVSDLNPQYNTDLVWEADKYALRKMRSGQTPLKVECFTVQENGTKEKIGYILLSVRSAQIIPKNKDSNVKMSWHRLLGLRNDLKAYSPELLLTLTIEERKTVALNTSLELKDDLETNPALSSNSMTPRLLHEERLIQLGPSNTCRDLFLLNITAGTAANLEFLLKEQLDGESKENFSFWYHVLKNDVQLKPFKSNSEKFSILNEKVVIRIRSSLSVLKNYLQENPFLFVTLRYKNDTVGRSEVDLRSLIPTENVHEFLRTTANASTSLEQRYYLAPQNNVANKGNEAYLDMQLKLQYIGIKNSSIEADVKVQSSNPMASSLVENASVISKTANYSQSTNLNKEDIEHMKFLEIDSHRNPGGDFGKCTNKEHMLHGKNANKHSLSCEVLRNQNANTFFSHSADALLNSPTEREYSKSVEAYHCYCLNVHLDSIELSSTRPTIRNIEFRFHHPKAEIMSTLYPKMPVLSGEKVRLQDIKCKLHFISSVDEIQHLLLSFPPKISVCDSGGDVKICLAQTILDVKQLFDQNKLEYRYEAPLFDMDQNKIGTLGIGVYLKDCGPYYRSKSRSSDENLGPPILDDNLAYKIVDELETWKERQQEIFRIELKRKEERHLNLLSEEWQKRRETLEVKLACSVEQCKMLANSLNNATEDLRARRLKSLEKEARLIKANEDLQWRYDHKLQELREASRKLQEDLTSKLAIVEDQRKIFEERVEPLATETERLRQIVKKQTEELELYQKGSLTQDQTASLLQELKALEEKLNTALRSKSFFKEQWGKAVREIHKMKMEHQQAIEVQIKNSKEELKNLDLEEMLCADSTALTNDQILLNQIQKEIDVIKPKPRFLQKDADEQIFTPIGNMYSKSNHSVTKSEMSTKSEEHDERLRMLIEERDSLLKTGSYTIDDAVIVKLNAEIRSLLITS